MDSVPAFLAAVTSALRTLNLSAIFDGTILLTVVTAFAMRWFDR